ncbi:MAG: DNA polymerase I, partial [Chitinivibrionales bacterium]|nr:DNA polymerase I [Chitinivibrionales bacterium]MBD3395550.1 DNA polymerase I [Chitinivibrionales bacterium]
MLNKHLYLVDGHALAYRAYFAMIRNPLVNDAGQPTSAVFGMANYLLGLIKTRKCPYLAVVFDSPKPSFRKELYEPYKANREEMPDDMQSQIPLLFRLVESLNIPYLLQEGLEADDILATLVRKAEKQGYTVSLITKDKDLMQLVTDKVHMLAPEGGGRFTEMGPPEILEKMGVGPDKILDFLALSGDSSDNIPGIPGVGPKTAIKILDKAGSLDNLLKDPSVLDNPKLEEKVRANKEKVLLSRTLATLKDDADIGITLESLAAQPVNRDASVAFFKEMGFQSLLRDPLFGPTGKTAFSVTTISTVPELDKAVAEIQRAGHVSIDTETTSMEPRNAGLVGISLAVETSAAWYIPVGHDDSGANLSLDTALASLRPVIESEAIAKIGQNLKYDYQVFKKHGIALKGIAFDTMIAAYLIEPGKRQFNMDALADQYLSLKTISIESLIGKGKDQKSFASVPVPDAARYAGEDAVVPLKLKAVFEPLLAQRKLNDLFQSIEIPLVTVLAELEWSGIAVDTGLLEKLSGEYSARLEKISQGIFDLAGEEFNLNSPKQIGEVFFGKLGLPKSKKTKTGLSTNVEALEKLAPDYPIARELLRYREVQKLLSTYVDALPQQVNPGTGRVHTSFNQTITATGRLSSTSPNLQNIPVRTEEGRRIREAFIADRGRVLVSADYSQIELRVLAHMSQDRLLIQAFEEGK